MRFDELYHLIAHEIGHHQDWENANRLTIPERLRFLLEVADRFSAPDRWRDGYLDFTIPLEYLSQKLSREEMFYRQLQEFWATIIGLYTTNPEVLKSSHPHDYALAERWYNRLTED